MTMLGMTVMALDRIETLAPTLRQLGTRHNGYGVREEHYITVGTALLWTLQKALGPAFTSEAHGAWAAAYGLIAHTMRGTGAMAVANAA